MTEFQGLAKVMVEIARGFSKYGRRFATKWYEEVLADDSEEESES